MENASKALIMAGGILIAMMLIGIFVYIFSQMAQNADLEDREKLMAQINEFNKSYESFNRKLLRGYDITTISNKADDYNIRYRENNISTVSKEEEIHIYVKFTLGNFDIFKNNEISDLTEYFRDIKSNYEQKIASFREKYFKCDDIKYNSVTGRVNALYFTEIDGNKLFN